MKAFLQNPITFNLLFIVLLAIVANVVVWLTDWSLLWVLIFVMSAGITLLFWFRSRRRKLAQSVAVSSPDSRQKP